MRTILCLFVLLLNTVAAQQLSAQSLKIEDGHLVLPHEVTFKEGTATLTDAGKLALTDVKAYLADKTYISLLRIEGHVATGKDQQKLSEERAMTVCNWLVKEGIDCKRLIAVGFGNTKPVSQSISENTRMVFVNAALRGHAIGGMPVDGGGNVAGDTCTP